MPSCCCSRRHFFLVALFAVFFLLIYFNSSCVAAPGEYILVLATKIFSFSQDSRRRGPLHRNIMLFPFLAALAADALCLYSSCVLYEKLTPSKPVVLLARAVPLFTFSAPLLLGLFITKHPTGWLTLFWCRGWLLGFFNLHVFFVDTFPPSTLDLKVKSTLF